MIQAILWYALLIFVATAIVAIVSIFSYVVLLIITYIVTRKWGDLMGEDPEDTDYI